VRRGKTKQNSGSRLTNTDGFERAEGQISKEFSNTGRGNVNNSSVVSGLFNTEDIDQSLFPEFVTTELQGTLEGITDSSGAETGQKSGGTFVLDDLAETTNDTGVVNFLRAERKEGKGKRDGKKMRGTKKKKE
jgi:hypothetical protein